MATCPCEATSAVLCEATSAVLRPTCKLLDNPPGLVLRFVVLGLWVLGLVF